MTDHSGSGQEGGVRRADVLLITSVIIIVIIDLTKRGFQVHPGQPMLSFPLVSPLQTASTLL